MLHPHSKHFSDPTIVLCVREASVVQQPSYVVRSLVLLGLVFGFSFGASFPALLHGYREGELRKMIAADL